VDAVATDVQKILRQVEDELTPILVEGITASITIHCGATQYIIEVNRKLTTKRKSNSKPPLDSGWDTNR
jgi:hypothetical protein